MHVFIDVYSAEKDDFVVKIKNPVGSRKMLTMRSYVNVKKKISILQVHVINSNLIETLFCIATYVINTYSRH